MSLINNLVGQIRGINLSFKGNTQVNGARDNTMAGLTNPTFNTGPQGRDELSIAGGNVMAFYGDKMAEYYSKNMKKEKGDALDIFA